MLPGIASPQDIRWSPDGKQLAIAVKSNIHIWNIQDWNAPRYQWELASPTSAIAWSPNGNYLACAIHDHSIWHGRHLAAGGQQGELLVWSTGTQALID
jgi:WD40 repeat protein